jgi:hypothetical protein
MIGDSVIDLSMLYKFKARYGTHQTSYPMFKEPHSSRLMWPGREVCLIPSTMPNLRLCGATSPFPRTYSRNPTERNGKNSTINLCEMAVTIIVYTARLTRDTLYLKAVQRLNCNFIFANYVFPQN